MQSTTVGVVHEPGVHLHPALGHVLAQADRVQGRLAAAGQGQVDGAARHVLQLSDVGPLLEHLHLPATAREEDGVQRADQARARDQHARHRPGWAARDWPAVGGCMTHCLGRPGRPFIIYFGDTHERVALAVAWARSAIKLIVRPA